MKHTANVSVSPTHKPGGVHTDDIQSHWANGSLPNTVGRPPRWRTSPEIPADSSERAGAPLPNTTGCGLLKQPYKQKIAKTFEMTKEANLTEQTRIPFVDLVAQYRPISTEIHDAIRDVLSHCNFILGAQVEKFEHAFAQFVGVEHAVGVSSGLDALRLALAALDIGPGDEVIVPANTYIATALAVTAVGAKPVLVDCEPRTYMVDVEQIERAITVNTKAIIPVHLTGQSAPMDPILELGAQHGLHVIEDAAQAHGTRYKDRACGAMGIAGCFSFYPGKNLGAYGDGGLVTTNDKAIANRLRCLRNYGQQQKYEHVEKGLNTRLDTIQAAVLNVTLNHLNGWNDARRRHAESYRSGLRGIEDLRFQELAPYSNHIYHLFIIETHDRAELQQYLESRGIQTGIHYPTPIHLQKAYSDLGYAAGDFPHTERLARQMLSLPMYPALTEQNIALVCDTVAAFFSKTGASPGTRFQVAASRS
jgi:dTDP-4-amino-4,6-dideoxygalactose transaminase